MIALFCTSLAAPLMAVAVAVSSPMGDLAPLLVPLQRRGLGLHARQTFLVPNDCLPICDPILAIINGCSTAACACTTENANELTLCIDCVITGEPAPANVKQAQSALHNYLSVCAASGVPLTTPTITPNPPSATGPTSGTPLRKSTTGVPLSSGVGAPPGNTSSVSARTSTSNAPKSTLSNGSGTTPTTAMTTAAPVTSQPSQSASGPPRTSGATGVGDRAEVMSMLFSLCLMVALLA